MRSKNCILLSVIILCGCAAVPMRTPNPKNRSVMLAERVTIEGVRIKSNQFGPDCGPTVLEALFEFYGKRIARKEISDNVRTARGMDSRYMIPYVNKQGFRCISFIDPAYDKRIIKYFLAQSLPVLAVGSGYIGNTSHIVILTGYDDRKKIFYVDDPWRTAVVQTAYAEFSEWHRRCDHLAYLIYPESRSIEKPWREKGELAGKAAEGKAKP